jgi:transposase-like protein
MVDISDDTEIVSRRVELTRVVRQRRWSDEEKARIVAEAIGPGAVIADVARRHDLAPQHLSNWIRAAKDGRFALPADGMPAFVPVVSIKSTQASGRRFILHSFDASFATRELARRSARRLISRLRANLELRPDVFRQFKCQVAHATGWARQRYRVARGKQISAPHPGSSPAVS